MQIIFIILWLVCYAIDSLLPEEYNQQISTEDNKSLAWKMAPWEEMESKELCLEAKHDENVPLYVYIP